jgi:hypothetical protein
MQLAKYFCTGTLLDDPEEWAHYALHFSEYTHFTSPIRRYADVIVHRVLSYSLELEAWQASTEADAAAKAKAKPRPMKSLTTDAVTSVSDQCNDRKAAAKKASEASSKVYMCDYLLKFYKDAPLSSTAIVTDMTCTEDNSDPTFDILIPQLGIDKRIHLNDLVKMGKLQSAEITPRGPAKLNSQLSNGGRNRKQASAPAPAPASTTSSSPSLLKSSKRLSITWNDGSSNVYSIFESIDVELVVRIGPPMDLDAYVISPALAADRAAKHNVIAQAHNNEAMPVTAE